MKCGGVGKQGCGLLEKNRKIGCSYVAGAVDEAEGLGTDKRQVTRRLQVDGAGKKDKKGRAMGKMLMGVRKELEVIELRNRETMKGLIEARMRIGGGDV